MSDQTVTTDSAGVNRTTEGQITTAPATEQTPTPPQESSPTTTQPSETTQKTDTAPAEDGKSLATEKAKGPEGAPEKYADYTVPEGFALDPAVKTEADKLFKGMNLTQAQAQELVNFYTAKAKESFEQPFNAYQEQRKEWRTQAEADPDMRGKLGAGKEVNVAISKLIDSLGDAKLASDFREALDFTGAGDNPAIIKALFLMSRQTNEGSHVAGRGPAGTGQQRPNQPARSPAADLWPNLPSVANQR